MTSDVRSSERLPPEVRSSEVADDVDGYLGFDGAFRVPVLVEAKTLTARYRFERTLEEGDRVALLADGEVFATATIDLATRMRADHLVRLNPEGYVAFDYVEAFVDHLREFYDDPGDAVGPATDLSVFGFTEVERV